MYKGTSASVRMWRRGFVYVRALKYVCVYCYMSVRSRIWDWGRRAENVCVCACPRVRSRAYACMCSYLSHLHTWLCAISKINYPHLLLIAFFFHFFFVCILNYIFGRGNKKRKRKTNEIGQAVCLDTSDNPLPKKLN